MMKILFICGSLEEGKDGIGDYTRKLSQECDKYNVVSVLVAVNDGYINDVQSGINNGTLQYRLPKSMSWQHKGELLDKIIKDNSPFDWISLQFVSYAYNTKGIIWQERSFFHRLAGINLQIMMHETWVGDENQASHKMKMLGWVQRLSIISLIKHLKPLVINTSVPLYIKILNKAGLNVKLLPLFSNISQHTHQPDNLPEDLSKNRDNILIGCLFGSIYYDSWNLESLFNVLRKEAVKSKKRIVIVSLGKIGNAKEFWAGLPSKYTDIEFLTLGMQDENYISYFLDKYVDFGIVTTPSIIAGKSGSCMAFLERGIPVFCKKNTMTFNFELTDDLIDTRVIEIDSSSEFKLPQKMPAFSQVKSTAKIFIQNLKNS